MRRTQGIACVLLVLLTAVAHACQCWPHDAKWQCEGRRDQLSTAIARDMGRWGHLLRPAVYRVTPEYQDELIRKGLLKSRVPDAPPFVRTDLNWAMKVPAYNKPHHDHFVAFHRSKPGSGRLEPQIKCLIHTAGWHDAELMRRPACWYPDCTGGDKPIEIDGAVCPTDAEWERLRASYGEAASRMAGTVLMGQLVRGLLVGLAASVLLVGIRFSARKGGTPAPLPYRSAG